MVQQLVACVTTGGPSVVLVGDEILSALEVRLRLSLSPSYN